MPGRARSHHRVRRFSYDPMDAHEAETCGLPASPRTMSVEAMAVRAMGVRAIKAELAERNVSRRRVESCIEKADLVKLLVFIPNVGLRIHI